MGIGEPGERFGAGFTDAGPEAVTLTDAGLGADDCPGDFDPDFDPADLGPGDVARRSSGASFFDRVPLEDLASFVFEFDPVLRVDRLVDLVALFLRRWLLGKRVPWPGGAAAALALAVLMAFRAALAAAQVTAIHLPARALAPTTADTCARILLAAPAAPPVPVTAMAGTAG